MLGTWKLKLIAGLLGLALLVGIFFAGHQIGYTKGEAISAVEIAQYEKDLQALNSKLATAQGKIDVRTITKYRDRVEYVDRVITKTRTVVEQSVPEQFTLSKGWVYAYNSSIRGTAPDPALASNPEPSTVSEMRALAGTIVPNNGICLTNSARLDALQNWVKESGEVRNED